ncbi:BTAD domain-containing putative transcriptional regulator [Nakamurella sp.]|uniref:BTAD domain-containing putative transcriptional regulator n=1 Tax=Nakamurella sp. TaxID=1869182 RepID=UPI003B3BA6FA
MRDLGALVVAVGAHDRPVVGTRGAAMLALLTINVNQRVSVDALMEAAWGERISAGAASTLVSHIWRLRQLLEPDRDRRQAPTVLVNDSDGYRLVGSPSTLDSLLFAEASGEVRDLLAAGHAQAAVRRADAALALWRGRPYGALAEADWARSAVTRLEELRGQLQERRVEGLLATGAADAALGDLSVLIAANPFREPLRALQMEALYRSGRGEEALHAYQAARQVLADEVGIDPGAELQEMHRRILSRDPALDRRPERPAIRPREVEVHLPSALTPLVGRADVLPRLATLVRDNRLVTITGAAGCGKTRVAVEAARAVVQAFPDGVWFVDLTAVSEPDLVVDVVVSTIGFAPTAGATPLQDLRRYLHSRRILLVLDNCEHVLGGVDQVVRVALSDAGDRSCLLTTSREPIGIDGETIWTLEPLALPEPDGSISGAAEAPAVELFLQRLASVAPTLEMTDEVLTRAREISLAVDGLPLPLELAAARALSHSLDDIARQVTADPGRLSRVGRGPGDHRATVRSAIEWSHQLLAEDERIAHRRLSVLPGTFTAGLASAVVGTDTDADDLLAQLVHRSLLSSERPTDPLRPSGFRQLATVRSHARHALDQARETAVCLDRRDGWTTDLLAARPPAGTAAEAGWFRAIDDDDATVRATLTRRLIDEPTAGGGRLAGRLSQYWYYRARLVEAGRWLQLGHDLLRQDADNGGDPVDELLARLALAAILAQQRRMDLVRPLIDGVEGQVRGAAPTRLVEVGEALVFLAMSCYTGEAWDLLVDLHRLLQWVTDTGDDTNLDLLTDAVGCCALLASGRLDESVALALAVHGRAEAVDQSAAGYISTAPLIITALMAGRPEDGIPWVDRCVAMHRRLGSGAIGMFTETKANFMAQLGEFPRAARIYAAAHAATRRAAMGWPNRELTRPLLALTRERLGRAGFEQAWQDGERLTPADIFDPSAARTTR